METTKEKFSGVRYERKTVDGKEVGVLEVSTHTILLSLLTILIILSPVTDYAIIPALNWITGLLG